MDEDGFDSHPATTTDIVIMTYEERRTRDRERLGKIVTKNDFPRIRSWIILARNKETGILYGEIEHSFSLELSQYRVCVNRSYFGTFTDELPIKKYRQQNGERAHAWFKQHHILMKQNPTYEWFVARVGSKRCPVTIDWSHYYILKQQTSHLSAFEHRNLPFYVKEVSHE